MQKLRRHRRLWDSYRFPGFRPDPVVVGVFGDPTARVVVLHRRSKKRCAAYAGAFGKAGMIARPAGSAICPAATLAFTWT